MDPCISFAEIGRKVTGKIVLVTGGNRGIGLEICKQLSELGHTVIMGSRSVEKGIEASRSMPTNVDVQKLDITSKEDLANIRTYVDKEFGRLDVLINNAAILIGSHRFTEVYLDTVRKIMETNFYGTWALSREMLPLLRKSDDGRIINVSSGMGALDDLTGGYAGYRLSKSSLNALTILMANELRGSLKVNAMCPGWVRTEMGGSGASRSVERGAETAVWLALHPDIPSGKFLKDKKIISW